MVKLSGTFRTLKKLRIFTGVEQISQAFVCGNRHRSIFCVSTKAQAYSGGGALRLVVVRLKIDDQNNSKRFWHSSLAYSLETLTRLVFRGKAAVASSFMKDIIYVATGLIKDVIDVESHGSADLAFNCGSCFSSLWCRNWFVLFVRYEIGYVLLLRFNYRPFWFFRYRVFCMYIWT